MDKYSYLARPLLRYGMVFVFLYFGISQLTGPSHWLNVVPSWASAITGNATTVVLVNGVFEVVAGLCLLLGFQVRLVTLLLAIHLFVIASHFGWSSSIGIRDFGLSIATLSIFFAGADAWCVDTKFKSPSSPLRFSN